MHVIKQQIYELTNENTKKQILPVQSIFSLSYNQTKIEFAKRSSALLTHLIDPQYTFILILSLQANAGGMF